MTANGFEPTLAHQRNWLSILPFPVGDEVPNEPCTRRVERRSLSRHDDGVHGAKRGIAFAILVDKSLRDSNL
jgi:hypothetical protein